jgi:hypothetical protein
VSTDEQPQDQLDTAGSSHENCSAAKGCTPDDRQNALGIHWGCNVDDNVVTLTRCLVDCPVINLEAKWLVAVVW